MLEMAASEKKYNSWTSNSIGAPGPGPQTGGWFGGGGGGGLVYAPFGAEANRGFGGGDGGPYAGGGNAGNPTPAPGHRDGHDGLSGTGGGGGCATAWEYYKHGGNGGAGTVVVRYEITEDQTGTQKQLVDLLVTMAEKLFTLYEFWAFTTYYSNTISRDVYSCWWWSGGSGAVNTGSWMLVVAVVLEALLFTSISVPITIILYQYNWSWRCQGAVDRTRWSST